MGLEEDQQKAPEAGTRWATHLPGLAGQDGTAAPFRGGGLEVGPTAALSVLLMRERHASPWRW